METLPSWESVGEGHRRAWLGAAASTAAEREAKFVQTLEGGKLAAHSGGTCVSQQ